MDKYKVYPLQNYCNLYDYSTSRIVEKPYLKESIKYADVNETIAIITGFATLFE